MGEDDERRMVEGFRAQRVQCPVQISPREAKKAALESGCMFAKKAVLETGFWNGRSHREALLLPTECNGPFRNQPLQSQDSSSRGPLVEQSPALA